MCELNSQLFRICFWLMYEIAAASLSLLIEAKVIRKIFIYALRFSCEICQFSEYVNGLKIDAEKFYYHYKLVDVCSLDLLFTSFDSSTIPCVCVCVSVAVQHPEHSEFFRNFIKLTKQNLLNEIGNKFDQFFIQQNVITIYICIYYLSCDQFIAEIYIFE